MYTTVEKFALDQYVDSTGQILTSLPHLKWTHIELGAANYAEDPGRDPSYRRKNECHKDQYKLLFDTIDELIQKKGKEGIFYVNDLREKDVGFTIYQLEQYIMQQCPDAKIELKPLIGNFFYIDLPKVDSIHLKNPEYDFFEALDDQEKRERLAYFANCSKEGLTFVTYYKRPLLNRLNRLKIGYKICNANDSLYIHADGQVVTTFGNTIKFNIKSLATIEKENQSGYTTKYSHCVLDYDINRYSDIYGPNLFCWLREEKYIDSYFVPPEEIDTGLKINNK